MKNYFDSYDGRPVNHYETLGVEPSSEPTEIRRAYLAAAREFHPDFHADADEGTRRVNAEYMQRLNEAWEVLGDPGARVAYDRSQVVGSDPGVARRAAREPGVPAGKGWTPRAGDDGWMDDYQAWADDGEELEPDVERSTGARMITVAPVALFGFGVLSIFIGLAVATPGLMAFGFIWIVVSAGLFFLLPIYAMARGSKQ